MKIASLIRFLNPVPTDMGADETAFCTALIHQKNRFVAIIAYRAALAFQLATLVIDRIVTSQMNLSAADMTYLNTLTAIHFVVITLCTSALVFGKRSDNWLIWPSIPTIVLLFAGYAGSLYSDVTYNHGIFAVTLSTLSTLAMGIFIVLMSAYGTAIGPAVLCTLFSGTMAWSFHSMEHGEVLGIVTGAIFLYTFAVKNMQIAGRWQAARSEFRETRRAAENERALVQHEMSLASAIQDSQRRTTSLSTDTMQVDFFMLKHATVGGDWYAAHMQPDGSLLVLMVDAAGKGLQAALVVHAVQSIWTAGCKDDAFEAGPWIKRLNDVLVEMGQGSPHAVALGLAKIEPDKMTYWCAGLGPIYVRRDKDGSPDITSHVGRGTMLGIQPSGEITIKPIVVDLDELAPAMVFLGTDGVLVGSRRADRVTIETLVDVLPEHAEAALRSVPVDDDKALIRVTIKPAAKAQRRAS